jgi:3-hydroxyacyl-CoA dehydrogenase
MQTAIIGCGLIGESWAALFLHHGHDVVAWDLSETMRATFSSRVSHILSQLAGMRDSQDVVIGNLRVERSLAAAIADASLVQENAPESLPLKRELYAEIESATSVGTLIASSTSSLVWSDLTSRMNHPNRFITAHPFNPPHLMPLVEIYGPDQEVVAQAEAFYRGLDRHPVRLKQEAVGHIANRLASALWREAVYIVSEGIGDVADVDDALVHGPGLRWSVIGAHMAYHLGGGPGGIDHYLKTLGPSQERRWATLGSPILTPEVCNLLVQGVLAEAGGRTIAELEAERDAGLRRALLARASVA